MFMIWYVICCIKQIHPKKIKMTLSAFSSYKYHLENFVISLPCKRKRLFYNRKKFIRQFGFDLLTPLPWLKKILHNTMHHGNGRDRRASNFDITWIIWERHAQHVFVMLRTSKFMSRVHDTNFFFCR